MEGKSTMRWSKQLQDHDMYALITHLHPRIVYAECKVAVPDLQWCRLIVNQARADNIVLGHNFLPTTLVSSYSIHSNSRCRTCLSVHRRAVAAKVPQKLFLVSYCRVSQDHLVYRSTESLLQNYGIVSSIKDPKPPSRREISSPNDWLDIPLTMEV